MVIPFFIALKKALPLQPLKTAGYLFFYFSSGCLPSSRTTGILCLSNRRLRFAPPAVNIVRPSSTTVDRIIGDFFTCLLFFDYCYLLPTIYFLLLLPVICLLFSGSSDSPRRGQTALTAGGAKRNLRFCQYNDSRPRRGRTSIHSLRKYLISTSTPFSFSSPKSSS